MDWPCPAVQDGQTVAVLQANDERQRRERRVVYVLISQANRC